jgi:hypothetical protein
MISLKKFKEKEEILKEFLFFIAKNEYPIPKFKYDRN